MRKVIWSLLFLSMFVVPLWAQKVDTTRTLTVTGVGSVEVIPDICIISAGVMEKGNDPQGVMNSLANKINSIINTIESVGVKKGDIKTSKLSLSPIFETQKEKKVLTGYSASEHLTVKTQVKDAGRVLSTITNAGVNVINSITFDYSNKDSLALASIEKATENARRIAERALSGTGYHITGMKNVQVDNILPTYISYYSYLDVQEMRAAPEVGNVPVEEGTIKVTSRIYIVFTFE